MDRLPHMTERCALTVQAFLLWMDIRVLVACVSLGGLLAWVLPWQATALFLVPAALIAATAARLLRDGRSVLAAYGLFVLLWTVSQYLLYLFENPGQFAQAIVVSAYLGARLLTLLGLALAVPLVATPLMLGRTLTWYLTWLVVAENTLCTRLFRGKIQPFFAQGVWQAALALSLMMAFFPRSLRAMKSLRQSLTLRAPRLKLHQRVILLGLAMLRVVSSQTWDMTLALAARDLCRPEPWKWRDTQQS